MSVQCPACGDKSTSIYVCTSCGAPLAPKIPHRALTLYLTPPPGRPLFWNLTKEQTPAAPRHADMGQGRRKVALDDSRTVALIDQLEAAETTRLEVQRRRKLVITATVLVIGAVAATAFVL